MRVGQGCADMDESALTSTGMEIPDPLEVEAIVKRTQTIFRRTLASWATDLLMLRHTGVVDPTWSDRGDADTWSNVA